MPGPNPTKLFISYAHADGAELAQHLQRDLAAGGLEPWLDSQRLYGGAIWTKEIEDAIDSAEVVLALLSRGSYASEKMDALPAARTTVPAGARKAIARLLPVPQLPYRIVRRIAGVGSLGHPRYVAVADWRGGQIALEAKASVPSACLWARPTASSRVYYQLALDQAIRCPDPFVRLSGKWLVRQLAPDSSPIEIETMNGQKDQDRLLHAMAGETANVHLGSPRAGARIVADLNSRSGKWLRKAVKDMAAVTIADWKDWKKSQTS